MAVFTGSWDETVPADTDLANTLGVVIRNLKRDLQERLAIDHTWDGDSEDGTHDKVTFNHQASDPTPDEADQAVLYTKDVSGTKELFFKNSAGDVMQVTSGGSILFGSGNPLPNGVGNGLFIEDSGATAREVLAITGTDDANVGNANVSLRLLGDEATGQYNGSDIWHAGNDGAASGLDADTVDGIEAADLHGTFAYTSTTSVIEVPTSITTVMTSSTLTAPAAGDWYAVAKASGSIGNDTGGNRDAGMLLEISVAGGAWNDYANAVARIGQNRGEMFALVGAVSVGAGQTVQARVRLGGNSATGGVGTDFGLNRVIASVGTGSARSTLTLELLPRDAGGW